MPLIAPATRDGVSSRARGGLHRGSGGSAASRRGLRREHDRLDAGSLGTGFVLIPGPGTQNSLRALGAVNGLLALLLATGRFGALEPARGWHWLVASAPLACLLAMPLLPADRVILAAGIFRGDRPEDLLYFDEDAATSVTVRRRHDASPYLSSSSTA